MFAAFVVFILTCGLTHAMASIVLCIPLYRRAGDIRLGTVIASVATAVTPNELWTQIFPPLRVTIFALVAIETRVTAEALNQKLIRRRFNE